MTCVQKEYEVKIKNGTGSMTTAKNEVLNWLLLKNCYSVGAMNLWWWVCVWTGLLGEFSLVRGTSLHHPSRENPV